MTKVASTDEAMAFAKQEVLAAMTDPIDIGGISVRLLSKQDNREFACWTMANVAKSSPGRLAEYVDYAMQGWGLAQDAMQRLISEIEATGAPLPPPLSSYAAMLKVASPRKLPGQKREDNFLRDIAIALTVQRVRDRYELTPTARHGNASACGVVSEALGAHGINVTYKQVETIWGKVGKMIEPDPQPS